MLVAGSAATLLQGFLYGPLGKEVAMQIAVAGMVLVVASFVWAGLAIRCPKCDLKIFFHALTKEGFFSWFAWLLQTESCPKCGHPETSRRAGSRSKAKGLKRP